MTWHKVDTHVQCSPRLLQIGRDHGQAARQRATLAWLAVLAVNTEHDCDGKLGPMYSHPEYLATFCPALAREELDQALQHLVAVKLVERHADVLTVSGWDVTWRTVMPSTARVKLHREIKALSDAKKPQRQRGAV